MDFRVPRSEMLFTREQINGQIDDLLIQLRFETDKFSALLPLPYSQCNSPKLKALTARTCLTDYLALSTMEVPM